MGKEEEEAMAAAEGAEQAAMSRSRGGEWYRKLLQALVWSRRVGIGYHRLNILRSGSSSSYSNSRRKSGRVRVARLGNKRAFRLRTAAARMRMRWRWLSPLSLLAKLRNAYVDLMLSASAKLASSSEGLAFGGGVAFPSHPFLFSSASYLHSYPPSPSLAKQHDKILMDLYMSMSQHHFLCPTSSFS